MQEITEMQRLLEKRKSIFAAKRKEAEGISRSVKLVWGTHNKKFDEKIVEIGLKINAENSKGIKKRIKQHSKRE